MDIVTRIIIGTAVIAVVSSVAERFGTRAAGIIMAFPTTTAINLYLIAGIKNIAFASQAAIYTPLSMIANIAYLIGFIKGVELVESNRGKLIVAPVVAVICFFLTVLFFDKLAMTNVGVNVMVSFIVITVFGVLFRSKSVKVKKKGNLVFKSVISGTIIAFTTKTMEVSGPNLGGLLASFPATIFPALMVLLYYYGEKACISAAKHTYIGLYSVLFFSQGVHHLFPIHGKNIGLIMSLGLSVIVVISATYFEKKLLPSLE